MPLLLNFLRSFSVMFDSRLRSSCSIDFFRHRSLNSHSTQWRFKTRSGGEWLASNLAIFPIIFLTFPARAAVCTYRGAWSAPWTILPQLTSEHNISESTSASNASSNLSSQYSLLVKVNRIGINCAWWSRPSDETRSTAWSSDSRTPESICVRAAKLDANRHLAVLKFFMSGEG